MTEPKLFDSAGRPVRLASEIDRGGEGVVWQLGDTPDRVAKIYHSLTSERAEKLLAMVARRDDVLAKVAAWPVDTLHRGADGGAAGIAGFVMPRADGRQVHVLYGPKSRVAAFPQAHWAFLVQAAANLARAFAQVHDRQIVVGDVNHGNCLVSDRATVTMIDCDSFQIEHGGRCFPCGVGVETHVPPELQGRDLTGVRRMRNHDAFGLAVLLFQMLFMGRHPFSGRYQGRQEMPIPRSIREHRFAYGPGAARRGMRPPPHTLALEAVGPAAALFERAFAPEGERDGGRPAAAEWAAVLAELGGRLRACGQNPAHRFLVDLAVCPWCAIETDTGALLFGFWLGAAALTPGPELGAGGAVFQLAAAWARVVTVTPPALAPTLPAPEALAARPTPAARRLAWRRWALTLLAGGCAVAFLVVVFLGPSGIAFLLAGAGVAAWRVERRDAGQRRRFRDELARAEAQLRVLHGTWEREASNQPYAGKLRDLKRKRATYVDLPAARRRELAHLQATLRQRQLAAFLDTHRIEHARIKGVGASRRTDLQSFGIETAADVEAAAIEQVPGFGPVLAQRLVAWRQAIAAGFLFDAARGIDPADVKKLDAELAARRGSLERDLLGGPAQLANTRLWVEARRQALLPQIAALSQRVAQARADVRAAG
jgi:DNA-binding helix-hairpin-helix protein with protein kinase domain